MSTNNTTPTTTTFDATGAATGSGPTPARPLSNDGQGNIFFGLRPFVGMEYYILPKMSLGLEFGYSLTYNTASESTAVTEAYIPVDNEVVENETTTAGSNTFNIGTDNLNGALVFMFYF